MASRLSASPSRLILDLMKNNPPMSSLALYQACPREVIPSRRRVKVILQSLKKQHRVLVPRLLCVHLLLTCRRMHLLVAFNKATIGCTSWTLWKTKSISLTLRSRNPSDTMNWSTCYLLEWTIRLLDSELVSRKMRRNLLFKTMYLIRRTNERAILNSMRSERFAWKYCRF